MGSLYDLLKNEVTTMKEAADLVPELILYFREKIKEIEEKEENKLVLIHIPFDVYEQIIPYMIYSGDFDKIVPWELRRTGHVGTLDTIIFQVYFHSPYGDQFKEYLFYELEDGTRKILE